MTEYLSVIGDIIIGILALFGTYLANRKTQALMAYRLDKVEEKLDKHNHFDDRINQLETASEVHAAELHRHNERLKTLEAKP